MSGAEDETTIVLHDWKGSGGFGGWNPPANAHFDEGLRQLREDPGAVERMAAAIDRELERRRALFGEAPNATPQR